MGSPIVSPRLTARVAGTFYLLYVVIAALAGVARRGILVAGAAAAYVVVVVALHQLLKPVNGSVSLLAASFGFMGCILMAVGGVFQLAPLTVLTQPSHPGAFSADQAALAGRSDDAGRPGIPAISRTGIRRQIP